MDPNDQKFQPDVRERTRAYWRRRGTFYVVTIAGAIAAVMLAMLLPPTYRSTATILIEQQEIPQEMVRSVITSFADQRVQVTSQRVMTTQNLLQLIDRYNLYPDIREKEPREVLLAKIRGDIGMHMISADVVDPRSGRPTQATIAFAVSYQNHSPELALKVANELTTLYLNENLTSRTRLSQQTSDFFGEEAARQSQHIAELDQELADFKHAHHDELPEVSQLNIQMAERTELDLRDAQSRLSGLDSQRVLLQAQLAQLSPNAVVYSDSGQRVFNAEDRLKDLKSKLASYKARYAPNHPDVISTQREVDGLEKEVHAEDGTSDRLRQLSDAKAQLAEASAKYSADHPDVLRLKREVDRLQAAVAADANSSAEQTKHEHADNPVYIQVKGQLDALTVERENAVKKRDELQAKYDDYERRLSKSPDVERQYREMARGLESAQLKYQEILAKQTEAQVAQNLETERKGEKFTMIEPPQRPEKPVSPNRTLIICIGLLLAIAAGVGAVMARESFDGSVRGPGDIRQLLQVPALASIPVIVTARDRARRRLITRLSWGGSVSVMLMAAAAVHVWIRPLDVVWISLLRRFGV
jgi:uncharacterized protein involved in exopolysaccharide biosynthesis